MNLPTKALGGILEHFSSIAGRGARLSNYTPMHFHMADTPGWPQVVPESRQAEVNVDRTGGDCLQHVSF